MHPGYGLSDSCYKAIEQLDASKEQDICPQMNTDKIYIVRKKREEREQRKISISMVFLRYSRSSRSSRTRSNKCIIRVHPCSSVDVVFNN